MLTVQTYVLPVVAAVAIVIFGRRSVAPVLVVTAVPLLVAFGGLTFLGKTEVSLHENSSSKPARTWAYFAAYSCLPLAIFVTLNEPDGWTSANVIGFVAGLGAGALALALMLRRMVRLSRDQQAAGTS
jgi:small-conductance mechanosensitive channel